MLLKIVVTDGDIKNSYVTRHGIEKEDCLERKAGIDTILKGEKYFCVLGSFPRTEIVNSEKIRSWTYHKVKTKKGCVSWFLNEC